MATNVGCANATGIAYLKVSTRIQHDEGVSLDQQESSIRAYAEQHGMALLGVYREEALSGKLDVEARPALNQALQAVKETNSVLIVASLSRLARSQRVLWHIVDPNGDRAGRILP
jgi:site-specific DNA recombinase